MATENKNLSQYNKAELPNVGGSKFAIITSEYLFVKHDPSVSSTLRVVKFSDAIISKPLICRFFSLRIKSYISGSTSRKASRPVHINRLFGSCLA